MRRMAYLLFYGNRPAVVALALLLAARAVQAAALSGGGAAVGDTFVEMYAFCNAAHIGAFVLTPLLAVFAVRPAARLASPQFAVCAKTRSAAALRCLAAALCAGVLAAVAVNVSVALAILVGSSAQLDWSVLLFSTALQAAVCSIALMLYVDAALAAGRSSVAFMACILYGLWDFMAQNVVGGGIPSVGWGLTVVSAGTVWADCLGRISLFGMVLIALFLALMFCLARKDFIPNEELH